jgi:hypothetical protein
LHNSCSVSCDFFPHSDASKRDPLGKVSAILTVFVATRNGRLAGKLVESGHEQEIDDLVGRLLNE